jgi:heterodisulfide reductase subunit D
MAQKLKELEKLKDVIYTCTHCGNCKYFYNWGEKENIAGPNCPSGVYNLFDNYYGSRGRSSMAKGLLSGKLDFSPRMVDALYACTTCAACRAQCEVDFKDWINRTMETLRYEVVQAGAGLPKRHKMFGDWTLKEHNPYLEKHVDRTAWLPKEIKDKLPETAEYLYFVGCTSSYRQKNIALATVKLFQKVGLDFTVSEDEWCCGSPHLRTGQWDIAKEVARHNVELVKKVKAKKVITACAGCYRTLKVDYQGEAPEGYVDMLGTADFKTPVVHTIDVIWDLVKQGKLNLGEYPHKVTYHDPCHLGRHAGVYEPPRDVLKAIPKLELIEMPRNRDFAWCCGSGGGVKSGFADMAMSTAIERVKEAEATGAEILASTCPFCWRNLDDAIKETGSKLKMLDITEILLEIVK